MDYSKWTFWLVIGSILLNILKGAILLSRRLEAPKDLPVVNHDI